MKKKLLALVLPLIVLLFVFAVLYSRGGVIRTTTRAQELSYNLNSDKNITHITSGLIKTDTFIAARFEEGQVGKESLNKELDNRGIFWFEPALKGRVYWADEKTIVFEPVKSPLLSKSYTGVLDLRALFPELEGLTPEKKVFTFETQEQTLLSFSGDFIPAAGDRGDADGVRDNADNGDRNDGSQVVFSGRIELAAKVDQERLERAVSLLEREKLPQREYMLNINTADGRVFEFTSELIRRTDRERCFSLFLKGGELGLEGDSVREYSLAPAEEMTVSRIEEVREAAATGIRVVFSDFLDPELNYNGFVRLEPAVNFRTEVEGRTLLIRGDFSPGERYRLRLLPGFRGKTGRRLVTGREYQLELEISNNYPAVEFVNSGIYLTSAKNMKIVFRTMNLARVHLKVKRVEDSNLIDFLRENSYRPVGSYSSDKYNRYSFQRTGVTIESEVLELGEEMNKWIQSEIDLSRMVGSRTSALYIVQLEFAEEDALYFPPDWSNSRISSHAWYEGKISKHLIVSDLGITARKTPDQTLVVVTDVLKALPVEGALVRLMDEEGQTVETAYTGGDGMCILNKNGEYLEVRRGYQYAVLKFSETAVDTSLHDVGGIENKSGLKAFIYTDRGVYRPGDRVNISLIVRNEEATFPADHPVKLTVYNSQQKLVQEEVLKEGTDGFYSSSFDTGKTDPTGNWEAVFSIGSETFNRLIRIEEIVAHRIEVEVEAAQERLGREDRQVDFTISAKYLFGSPASGLESVSTVSIEPYEVSFDRYRDYTFTDQSLDFQTIKSRRYEEKLDEEGRARLSWELPEIPGVPSALGVRIDTRVLEKGGRPVQAQRYLPYKYYDRYVGIRSNTQGWLGIGSTASFKTVLLSGDGEPLAGERLKYRIYKRRGYWWWDYSSPGSFRSHFKTSVLTELAAEGEVVTAAEPVTIEYELQDYGEMLIEVEDSAGGHTAAYFFRSYWWGDSETAGDVEIINLRTDREKYQPGETARVIVNAPEKGRALVTVEKANRLLHREWQELNGSSTVIELEVREEYIPNAYVSVTIFQPYLQKENDLPVRMLGIVPLLVEKENSRLQFEVETRESVRPGEEFTVRIASSREAQFTVAVVDEGLLNITGFQTPDPWGYFFQKERLITRTFDTYDDIIGLNRGYIYHYFSTGGDTAAEAMAEKYRQQQLQPDQGKRFKPVALFAGPVRTDEEGKAVVSFTMPEYIGRVRVMVVGAVGGSYGSEERAVMVKSPLMVMPTLPRFLGPEDFIEVPVTVFAMEEKLGEVELKLEVDGPLQVVGAAEKKLFFTDAENRDVFFYLQAGAEIGQAAVWVSAASADESAQASIDLPIKPYNPYTYLSEEKLIPAGGEQIFRVPAEGIKGAADARLGISLRKNLKFNHRLQWLIRYPYGCLEQVTSSVFPQLYLKDIFELSGKELREIDRNINQAISRLREFQLSSGGFAYWPDGSTPTYWGTNYAGHFLLEARERGYYVPEDMLERWTDFQLKLAGEYTDYYLTWTYRLYLLSLSGEKPLNGLNYLRESRLDKLDNTSKYYLAAAYLLAGYEETAVKISEDLDTEVDWGDGYWWWSYGSVLRNRAIMLETAILFKDYELAQELYDEIAEKLSSNRWYSTQTTAYSLLAVGKYLEEASKITRDVKGKIVLPDGREEEIKLEKTALTHPLEGCFAEEVRVVNESEIPVYATLEWEGIPLKGAIRKEAVNLKLTAEWYDEEGRLLDPASLEQGSVFWGVFHIEKHDWVRLYELALVQLLPAGWEVENLRLSGGKLPDWLVEDIWISEPEYLDIRDDRVMWFFDSDRYFEEHYFVVKLNAVTIGNFYLPPTVVEAMYNNDYRAVVGGMDVKVWRNREEEEEPFNLLKIARMEAETVETETMEAEGMAAEGQGL